MVATGASEHRTPAVLVARRGALLAGPALLLAACAGDPAPAPAATVAAADPAPAPAPAPPEAAPPAAPDARVEIKHWQVGFVGSASWGRGTLIAGDGTRHPFRVRGAGIGGVGMARIRATGDVWDLRRVRDFGGVYGQLRAGAVAPGRWRRGRRCAARCGCATPRACGCGCGCGCGCARSARGWR